MAEARRGSRVPAATPTWIGFAPEYKNATASLSAVGFVGSIAGAIVAGSGGMAPQPTIGSCFTPVRGSHVSTVHGFPSFGSMATLVPQPPVVASHPPAAWHLSAAAHTIGLAPVHTPARHVSVRVHTLPSAHA